MTKVKKAVIPAAGFGTRFLPASKSQPKEMLPIVDTPTIHYVVAEAVASGITDILMVIGKGKRAIEEYFDRSFELESELEAKNKTDELKMIRNISEMANIHFVWQKELNGLGDAILHGKCHVGDEPFAVLLGDTLVESNVPVTQQLLAIFDRYQESVVSVEKVPREKVGRYGVIDGKSIDDNLYLVNDFVEKPDPAQAPSDLAIAGRYVFTPEIFEYIEQTNPGKNGEIQITDAMRDMVKNKAMYAALTKARRHDIGNKLDFLKTNVTFGLKNEELGDDFLQFLKDIVNNHQ